MNEIKNSIIPKKISKGSHIRVIAPVRSLKLLSDEVKKEAIQHLERAGYVVSFSKHVDEIDEFHSSSVNSRVEDLHEAFLDDGVDAILTVIGGYNSNQLLQHLDYELIARHPKIICGFSDVTALANAITSKTGMITYIGPHFSSWAMRHGFSYSMEMFRKSCGESEPYDLIASTEWSDDPWYLDQEKREFVSNDGYWVMNEGRALGRVVGGHVRCLSALQGTQYWPGLDDSILILEEDAQINPQLFDRLIQSLIQQKDFNGVKGILIGRFQKESNMSRELLMKVLSTKKELLEIPIIANVDFGHTTPLATLPIGGIMEISAVKNVARIRIIEH